MPRKAFVADLQQATKEFNRINVSKIKAGDDDGQISFHYDSIGSSTEVIAMVPELGDYPASHSYMFFTNTDEVEPQVHKAIDNMPECTSLKVGDMLANAVKILDKATAGSRLNPVNLSDDINDPMSIDSDLSSELQDEDSQDEYDTDDEAWSTKPANPGASTAGTLRSAQIDQKAQRLRLRHDLRLAKSAGFRVSHIGSLADGGQDGFVVLSIRVAKLGISEEALDAWNMEPKQYFVVVLRYTAGYQAFETLTGNRACQVHIRVGLCSRYKIDIKEAVAAFVKLDDKDRPVQKTDNDSIATEVGLKRIFIERPLEEVLNDRLIPLLKYRLAMGFGWIGSEEFLNDHQGKLRTLFIGL